MPYKCDYPGCDFRYSIRKDKSPDKRSLHRVPGHQVQDVCKLLGITVSSKQPLNICRRHFKEQSLLGDPNGYTRLRGDLSVCQMLKAPASSDKTGPAPPSLHPKMNLQASSSLANIQPPLLSTMWPHFRLKSCGDSSSSAEPLDLTSSLNGFQILQITLPSSNASDQSRIQQLEAELDYVRSVLAHQKQHAEHLSHTSSQLEAINRQLAGQLMANLRKFQEQEARLYRLRFQANQYIAYLTSYIKRRVQDSAESPAPVTAAQDIDELPIAKRIKCEPNP